MTDSNKENSDCDSVNTAILEAIAKGDIIMSTKGNVSSVTRDISR
jgi:hypothetical protein